MMLKVAPAGFRPRAFSCPENPMIAFLALCPLLLAFALCHVLPTFQPRPDLLIRRSCSPGALERSIRSDPRRRISVRALVGKDLIY